MTRCRRVTIAADRSGATVDRVLVAITSNGVVVSSAQQDVPLVLAEEFVVAGVALVGLVVGLG